MVANGIGTSHTPSTLAGPCHTPTMMALFLPISIINEINKVLESSECPPIAIASQHLETPVLIKLTDKQKAVAQDGQQMSASKNWGGPITGHEFHIGLV